MLLSTRMGSVVFDKARITLYVNKSRQAERVVAAFGNDGPYAPVMSSSIYTLPICLFIDGKFQTADSFRRRQPTFTRNSLLRK